MEESGVKLAAQLEASVVVPSKGWPGVTCGASERLQIPSRVCELQRRKVNKGRPGWRKLVWSDHRNLFEREETEVARANLTSRKIVKNEAIPQRTESESYRRRHISH